MKKLTVEISPRPETHAEQNARAYVRNTLMASYAYQTGETTIGKTLDGAAMNFFLRLTPEEQNAASLHYSRVWAEWRDSGYDFIQYVSLVNKLF